MADGRDSESSAILKYILDDLGEIKIILLQQDDVQESVGNTLIQNYVEEIKLHFDGDIAGVKFYIEKSLNELKKIFTREYIKMTSTKNTLDILKFYRNGNNQFREQVKDLREILNGTVKVLQNLHKNKRNQSSMTPPNLSVKVNESRYRKCGATPTFSKN